MYDTMQLKAKKNYNYFYKFLFLIYSTLYYNIIDDLKMLQYNPK